MASRKVVYLAVNGTLMRGFGLHHNLLKHEARYLETTKTEPSYRIWSINDAHPGMIRVSKGGRPVTVEVYKIPSKGLARILIHEPAGLCIGKIKLANQAEVLGVLAESALLENQKEITEFGGWAEYVDSVGVSNLLGQRVQGGDWCPDAPEEELQIYQNHK